MKAVLVLALVLMCMPAFAGAQQESAVMGLYFDEARTIHCADRGAYKPIEVWMWCNAPSIEVRVLSFRLIYSENALGATVTYNPNMMSISGTPGSSVDLGFSDCQTDWFWAFHQTIYPMNANSAMIQLAPYSTSMYPPLRLDSLRVMDCSYSPVPAVRISSACLNSCVTDYAPPVIEHVNYVTKTQLEVVFSETIDPASAEIIGKFLVQRYPKEITTEWTQEKRKGKIFVDYGQNVRGKTLASIYSPRPVPGAPVSTPLRWEELGKIYPTELTLMTVPARLKKTGDLWTEILSAKKDLDELPEIK